MTTFKDTKFVFGQFVPAKGVSGHTCTIGVDTDHFIVRVSYPEGGSYFTTIPISGKVYRSTRNTKCGFKRYSNNSIDIYDDWGHGVNFFCADPTVIDKLVDELVEWDVPNQNVEK